MNRTELGDFLKHNSGGASDGRIVILDGATGTELQRRGMPHGACPELWALENAHILAAIQSEYIDAGAEIIFTCTFGANRVKLESFGKGGEVREINRRLACLSKKTAEGRNCLVAGDIAPTGDFLEPVGELDFEECINIYKEQAEGLLEGGVDLFVIETMIDINEARAALIAVKETCALPVLVSMSFDEKARTLTGTDPVTALITLQSMGADAVGCNCSTGPEKMVEAVSKMKPYARVPVYAKPNAGVPKLEDGATVFDMGPESFAEYTESFAKAGVNLLGGCCGTTPEYIKEIRKQISGKRLRAAAPPLKKGFGALTSVRQTVFLGKGYPLAVIGEKINPTGKKKLREEFRQGLFDEAEALAFEQVQAGAAILDVNAGVPGIDEAGMMKNLAINLSNSVHIPLCFDTSSPEALEAALRVYPGRALVNSISLEKDRIEKMLPVAVKYGAMIIALPVGDGGIPENAEGRAALIKQIAERAQAYGYTRQDILADGLMMSVSSDRNAAMQTLELIRWCSAVYGCHTVIGLSNVSFGLPERHWVNSAFFAMAAAAGLSTVIANPSNEVFMNVRLACNVLTMADMNSAEYISHFAGEGVSGATVDNEKDPGVKIYNAVLKGDARNIINYIEEYSAAGAKPRDIIDNIMIPAINKVGELYESKKYYLPQLIGSADVMKTGMDYLGPLVAAQTLNEAEEKGRQGVGRACGDQKDTDNNRTGKATVVLAAVKGDIHDIGKNIVALMLKNYGHNVIDLGKDVPVEKIIGSAAQHNAEIIGVSALMTTTMPGMKTVIAMARERLPKCRVIVGGAAVDKKYAGEIGADGYAKDAYEAVKLVERLISG
ncbi:MAG: homocysteine S-methyltransferase family protein [Eubacteriales bacterium]|nr:homocysteine S-methyltransferase family protein [Eubacteriales bacterium]